MKVTLAFTRQLQDSIVLTLDFFQLYSSRWEIRAQMLFVSEKATYLPSL